MSASLEDLEKLPGSVKLGAAGAGGAGIAAVFLNYLRNPVVLAIIIFGTLLVILLLIGWGRIVKWKQAGKAKVFGEGLGAQLRATPQQVTDADSRAKLDDLRRKLQEGIDKMNATGKGVYVLPWYLMVGEPGSGKTKAVAAAAIALPGFQDPLQGAGGTVNMNWWFTNSGVILDTAGRLMLPEVATSHNPEWDEFLRTLGRRRPDCPINGLILTIPADTLLTDETSEIERKAGEIAFQFNKVQATLGIRFPVFVLVTKCDKILGFREFFESLNQPDQQAQMLGWSKPGSLDEPFRPDQVDQHLQKVHEQLVRRRLALIQDPVHTEMAEGRRLDQVDASYELPDALLSVAPRLRRYLEPIFIAGPLSSKPLFLRGIYFTSSLQTGEALDKAMSEIMGRDIAAEHGGPIVSAKPYFLRDLFQEKVFVEQGLVTRTDNVRAYKRRQKRNLLAAGCVGALVLMGFTWLGHRQLQNRIKEPQTFWADLAQTGEPLIHPTEDGARYTGSVRALNGAGTSADVHGRIPARATEEISIPIVYRPVATISGDLKPERRQAYAAYFNREVVAKVVSAARARIRSQTPENWAPADTEALIHLLLIEGKKPLSDAPESSSRPLVPLTRYLLSGADRTAFARDEAKWDATFKWIYSPVASGGGGAAWPPSTLEPGTSSLGEGVEHYVKYLEKRNVDTGKTLTDCKQVAALLAAMEGIEKEWVAGKASARRDRWEAVGNIGARPIAAQWKTDYGHFGENKRDLEAALGRLRKAEWGPRDGQPELDRFYNDKLQLLARQTLEDATRAKNALPTNMGGEAGLSIDRLIATTSTQSTADLETTQRLKTLQNLYLTAAAGSGPDKLRYQLHHELLKAADGLVPEDQEGPPAAVDLSSLPAQLAALDKEATDAHEATARLAGNADPDSRESKLLRAAGELIDLGAARRRSLLLASAIDNAPTTADAWKQRVKMDAVASKADVVELPLTGLDGAAGRRLLPEFNPSTVAGVGALWTFIDEYAHLIKPLPTPEHEVMDSKKLKEQFTAPNTGWSTFHDEFSQYWEVKVPELEKVRRELKWRDFQAEFSGKTEVAAVDRSLAALRHMQAEVNPPKQAASGPGGEFRTACEECRRRWAEFTDAEDARVKLLAASDEQRLIDDYVVGLSAEKCDRYWPSVFIAALNALANEADAAAAAAVTELKQARAFPLGPPGPPEKDLTQNQLKEVRKLLRTLVPAPRPKPNAAMAAARDEAPVAAPDPAVRIPLAKLAGRDALKRANDLHVAELVSHAAFIDALADGKLRCSITFMNAPGDNARRDYVWVNLFQNGAAVHPKGFSVGGKDPEPKLGLPIPSVPGTLDLAFAVEFENQRYKPVTRIGEGQWPCLRLIISGNDRTVESEAKEPATWLVTYTKVKGTGHEDRITVKVKFTGEKQDPEIPLSWWSPDAR